MEKNNVFVYKDSELKEHAITIEQSDFEQVKIEKRSFERKFEDKPTTFAKDAFKRFLKNKSSVAGGIILGLILLLVIFVPMFSGFSTDAITYDEKFLEPKLFNAGTGFWDGTKYIDDPVTYDEATESPDPTYYRKEAVSELKIFEGYSNSYAVYNKGGYVRFVAPQIFSGEPQDRLYKLESAYFTLDLTNQYNMEVGFYGGETDGDYKFGSYKTYVIAYENAEKKVVLHKYYFEDEFSQDFTTKTYDVTKLLTDNGLSGSIEYVAFGIDQLPSKEYNSQVLFDKIIVTSSDATEQEEIFDKVSFTDANYQVGGVKKEKRDGIEVKNNLALWTSNGNKFLYHAYYKYCNFRYDTYLAAYGHVTRVITKDKMREYIKAKYCTYDPSVGPSSFKVLNEEKCPIVEVISHKDISGTFPDYEATCIVLNYKYLGYDKPPKYIFGTTDQGKDLFTLMFKGLRTSLLLGLITSAVNFIIGIIWGAISGYFGGWVDIFMERFTDILGRVPWMVIMTLCILHLGRNFATFALALCLTGWMGVAGTTRAQFYRFKGREYVLASRTLGASDVRLIFRHILPNSLGTLVTSTVFMIPGVIYSESTLAYLNLGMNGSNTFGVILADYRQFLSSATYLVMIPAVLMAIMMVSFNLFGNGLRDALNPSLKGSD